MPEIEYLIVSTGEAGTSGADGAPGSQWYTSAGVPSPLLGVDGDMYLDSSNGDVYQKVAGSWVLVTNITGPVGPGSSLELYDENPSSPTPPNASGTNAVAIGYGAVASSADNIAIGRGAVASIGLGTAVGYGSSVTGAGNTAIAVGQSNAVSAAQGMAFGHLNTVSGTTGLAVGYDNDVTANGIAVGSSNTNGAGYTSLFGDSINCTSTMAAAVAFGRTFTVRHPLSFTWKPRADVDMRKFDLCLYAQTTDATLTTLYIGGFVSTTYLPLLQNDSTWKWSLDLVARRTDVNGESAGYHYEGVIDRGANAASTALVGAVQETMPAQEDNPGWAVTISADTVNGGLLVQVVGEVGKTIRWVGFLTVSEVVG